jgi:hypothetical protein
VRGCKTIHTRCTSYPLQNRIFLLSHLDYLLYISFCRTRHPLYLALYLNYIIFYPTIYTNPPLSLSPLILHRLLPGLRFSAFVPCSRAVLPRTSPRAKARARRGADRRRRGRSSSFRAPPPLSAPALPLMVAGEAKVARRCTGRPPLRSPRASLRRWRVQRRCGARAAAVLQRRQSTVAGPGAPSWPCLNEARPARGGAPPADCANCGDRRSCGRWRKRGGEPASRDCTPPAPSPRARIESSRCHGGGRPSSPVPTEQAGAGELLEWSTGASPSPLLYRWSRRIRRGMGAPASSSHDRRPSRRLLLELCAIDSSLMLLSLSDRGWSEPSVELREHAGDAASSRHCAPRALPTPRRPHGPARLRALAGWPGWLGR